jgi:hypothetical protein
MGIPVSGQQTPGTKRVDRRPPGSRRGFTGEEGRTRTAWNQAGAPSGRRNFSGAQWSQWPHCPPGSSSLPK